MTPTNDWITNRRPTEADGDSDGDVLARRAPDDDDHCYLHWSYVGELTPWKHCADWLPFATPEPTPTPRKFASLTRTVTDLGHVFDAIDDDGVAWWMTFATDGPEPKWYRHLPLPAKESQQ